MQNQDYKLAPCPTCGHYYNRAVSVDGLITIDNKIVLIKRAQNPYKDYWALPGGYVDWNETMEEAVSREVEEETSLKVIKVDFMKIYSLPQRHPEQLIAGAYIIKTSGTIKAGDDAADIQLFHYDDLPEALAFDHESMIADYLEIKD